MDTNEPPEQTQPPAQFPRTTMNITPQGMQITIELAPGFFFVQAIPEDVMSKLFTEWLKTRKEIATQLATQQAVIDQVRRSKLH